MKLEDLNIKERLPLVGIVAFSLCSVWSLYHLLADSAKHTSWLFWLPAVLVELVTAWAVYQVVEQTRRVTRSNISKQDRRFYGLVLAAFVVVAIPTLAASVWANTIEFGHLLLGSLFPVGSIGCAIGVALPDTVARYEARREAEAGERKAERTRRKRRRKQAQEIDKMLTTLGKAAETLMLLAANPRQTQASIAQHLSISRQTVGNHYAKLEQAGAIKRNGGGEVEVLWDLPNSETEA